MDGDGEREGGGKMGQGGLEHLVRSEVRSKSHLPRARHFFFFVQAKSQCISAFAMVCFFLAQSSLRSWLVGEGT